MYCTTGLCLSVDKLKKKNKNNREDSGKEETVLVYRCQCYNLSHVKTERTFKTTKHSQPLSPQRRPMRT